MYRPKRYQKDEEEFILPFIQNHPFATFIMNGDHLLATHIPVLLDLAQGGKWRLYSHIANHNVQKQFLEDDVEVLVIFHGAQSYISSSWYNEPNISTWDYSAVHIHGKIKVQTNQELRNSLGRLIAHFENNQKDPLLYHQIPTDMVEEHLPQITGFWIEPNNVEGIAKLHQTFDTKDVVRVTTQLDATGDATKKQVSKDIKKEHNLL